jgi:hypothetical protein
MQCADPLTLLQLLLHADDDALEPAVGASSGWEAVQHLRQQHPNMRTSLRTSADITRVLRNSNITEAAYLSSMASQVHILHDAGGCWTAAADFVIWLVGDLTGSCMRGEAVRPAEAWRRAGTRGAENAGN